MRIIYILFFILLFYSVNGQEKTIYIVEEYLISINQTHIRTPSSQEPRNGIGVSLNHLFKVDESANVVVGIEYNRTSYSSSSFTTGRVLYLGDIDLIYTNDFLSIPLGIRFYFGKKVKIFFELGSYFDITLNSKRKGTWHDYNYTVIDSENINEDTDVPSMWGFSAALGAEFYISKKRFTIKTDYKRGSEKLQSADVNFYRDYYRLSVGINLNE